MKLSVVVGNMIAIDEKIVLERQVYAIRRVSIIDDLRLLLSGNDNAASGRAAE